MTSPHDDHRSDKEKYETETGVCYGCAPCDSLGRDCKGAPPGAFYYPHDCPSFHSDEDYQRRLQEEEEIDYI